ncbi:MAG: hypothetical protein IJI73_02575 [Kiritimatiellae bacterium]|nr:hypothetical protein [Kiritimatiellia bacterium]
METSSRVAAALARSRRGGRGGASAPSPRVLAMYDVSVNAGGRKWQPRTGEPVRVDVELAEPVPVSAAASLGVVHLADDGTVEELPSSRYGFTFNAGQTAVTAFWFSATGFSVYSIVDKSGNLVEPRRFYHFYGHPTTESGRSSALPYIYRDETNDVVNVQIVKDGDMLKEPPIPLDILDEYGLIKSMFEGWYVVSNHVRSASAVESKLDPTNEYFQFVWPVGATDRRMTFTNAVSVTETEDWDYYVVPLYEHARFLQFNENAKTETEQGAAAHIIKRKLVAINDETGVATLKVSDVQAALKNSRDEYFCGWEYLGVDGQLRQLPVYSGAGKPQDQYITVDDALFEANGGSVIPLYPYYVSAHFLHFDSNAGGSHAKYVGSVFVRSSSNFSTVETSGERKGYNFTGWRAGFKDEATKEVTFGDMVTDANGNFIPNKTITNPLTGAVAFYTDAQGNIRMNEDVTLYGTWAANSDSTYRVIIWQQRVTDSKDAADAEKKYYYVTHYTSPVVPSTTQISENLIKSFSGTAASGTNPDRSNLTTISGKDNLTDEDFTGFHYGRWECKDETVAPDASTVINVYYDRDLITLSFCVAQSTYTYTRTTGNSGTQYGTDNGTDYYQLYYKSSGQNKGWYKDQNYRNAYSGNRYTRSVTTSQTIDDSRTMTGLYGQTLADNGYTWDSTQWWYDKPSSSSSRTRTTFLDAFLPTSGSDETFYGENPSSTSTTINFYKEALDGSWILANSVPSGSGSFNISDKYNGFEAYQYSKNGGDYQSVGAYNESTKYYGSQVSSYTTLDIRFKRKAHELIYKYNDDTREHTLRTVNEVAFEKPLAEYDIAYTNLNWSGCDVTNRTFSGWYEDASLTVPFDFTATMPNAKKIIYAKWSPLQYKVIIDPNGGELHGNDSTWFYVDPDKNETIKEYHPTRDYRLDMHNGTYYYHHDLWDPLGDKHVTDTNSPSFIHNISRKAFYTTDIAQATSNEVSNPENRYTYDPGAYAFMGWFEVLADGTLAVDPFSFGEPPNRPITIRAIWRRTGIYTLKYESIDPDGWQDNEVIYDPLRHATGNIEDGYVADAETTLAKTPTNYDPKEWVWEGWQVIDTYNNNIPLTNVRSPGDPYLVKPAHADPDNVIHFRAVYKYIGDGSSRHIPNVTDFVLDSNENAGLAGGAALPPHEGRTGTYTDGTVGSVNGLNQGVWFAGQQNNFSVNLADYSDMFAHDNGYFLLGWDPLSHVNSLIPTFTAEQTIGVDTKTDAENALYAVWEPQIYVEFVNDTGYDLSGVQLYIPSWVDGELFRVNNVTGTYGREAFTAFSEGTATFDLAAGETLRLVLPDAADKDFTVGGTCGYAEGSKLVVTRIQPSVDGQEAVPDVVQSVYPGEHYMVAGTMKVSPSPVQVRFTRTACATTADVPVRYFIHHPDGGVDEITADNATVDGGAAWGPQKPLRTISGLGAATNDLAATLRYSDSLGVVGFLAPEVREQYGHTTIGVGSRSAVVTAENFSECEYRTITNVRGRPSGGSYLRFARESLMWSRYSQIWNQYDAADTAVYVAFYKRIPVHVTLQKSVVGSEEDRDVPFAFTATYSAHSTNIEYVVTHTYTQTREWTRPWYFFTYGNWSAGQWTDPVLTGVSTNVTGRQLGVDTNLFGQLRSPETVVLKDGERHPFTIFYDRADPQTDARENTVTGKGADESDSGASGRNYTQTRTITQVVTYNAAYRYETVTIQEGENSNFVLTAIGPDPLSQSAGHSGKSDLGQRTYTISSLRDLPRSSDNPSYYDYTPLDTAVFTNTRKTGSVTVTKTVVDGEEGDTFPFIVTIGETVVGKDSYTPPPGVRLGPYGKVFTFSLADGGSVTLPGLPAGASYKVEEAGLAKYIATVPANAAGTVEAGATTVVAFTNTHKTDIEIAMKDMSVIFTGEEQHGYAISTVAGTGSAIDEDAYTVTGLKGGHVLTVERYVAPHGTAVGSYTGRVENVRFTVRDSEDEDVTNEYMIKVTPGALSIEPTPIVVTITGNTTNVVYNGKEQSVQGYTYVITHATSHEVITSDSVYVSIPPDYQMAWRKDVGRSDMAISANHVIVTVPEGMSVSEVVVAANGYLEITPAPVTVKADNKVKILNRADPSLTATVTGLFGGDTVEYALSRAAGEAPGTYAITAAGNAAQGNYAVAYEAGTLTIEALDLIQRATGSGVSVSVPVSDEMLDELGFDSRSELSAATVAETMNKMDPNGLRRWENLVTGTATNELLLSTAVDAAGTSLTFRLSEDPVRTENLGYAVLHELRKRTGGSWTRLGGITADKIPTFPLDSDDVTGYYRIVTLIIPDSNLAITNEIPTTNIVGVLRIASTATHTMAAVPFVELPRDPALKEPVKVEEYVGSGFVKDGDVIRLREDGAFKVWKMEGGTFVPYTAVRADGSTVEVAGAEKCPLAPGRAVWVTRSDHGRPFTIVGQFSGEPVTVQIAGSSSDAAGKAVVGATMVANPNLGALRINDIDWGGNPGEGDEIEIPADADGRMSVRLKWYPRMGRAGLWGGLLPTLTWNPETQRYDVAVPTDHEIPAGMGFWYYRAGGPAFSVSVKAAEEID